MITNQDKILNLIGLAQKAGKIVSGNDLVISAMKQKSVNLVIVASDLSPATLKEFEFLHDKYQIPLLNDFSADELSQTIGKKRKIIGLKDQGFTKAIIEKLEKE